MPGDQVSNPFQDEVGVQATMFDPAGNALEFKAFADISQLSAK
jgi:extradiol dioxygenase family protein